MLTYFGTTALGTFFASLAGNRACSDPEGEIGPRRRGAPAVMAFLVGLIFVGVAGLRYRIGVDYWQYAEQYHYDYSQFTWRDFQLDNEPAFSALATFGAFWYDDPASMFFLASLITVGLIVRTYAKYSPMFALSILLLVVVGTWHGSFNGVRQFLAAAIVLAGHHFIVERRVRPFFLVVMLASLFHFSAWICLLLYFVPRRSIRLGGVLILTVCVVTAAGSYDLIAQALTVATGDDVASGIYFAREINPLRVGLAFGPYLVYLLFVDRSRISSIGHFYANLTLVHGAIYVVAISSAYLARFALYTNVFLPLSWPVLFAAMSRKNRTWLVPLVVVVYSAYWYLEVSPVSALNTFRWLWSSDART